MAQHDVSYIPFQANSDNTSSPILQMGSCFILDNEGVRTCPLLELRQRDYLRLHETKKRSLTERMTCVRNNIRENYFVNTTSGLEQQKCKTLQKLHESCSKLRHEAKLLDVDRLRRQVEVRKRLDPEKDYSQEDQLLDSAARRLNTGVTSCYLDKGMKYPTRNRSLRDTPTVRKARESLRIQESHKSIKNHTEIRTSNSLCVESPSNQWASISRTFSRNQAQYVSENDHFRSAKHISSSLPDVSAPTPLMVSHSQYTSGHGREFEHPPQIKSPGFDNLMKITAGTNKKLITLPSSICDQLSSSCDSSDDEHSHLPESVDLKSHFFSQRLSTKTGKPTLPSFNNTRATPQLMLPRKLRGATHRLLTGALQNEVGRINSKVLEFLKSFPVPNYKEENYTVNYLHSSSTYQIINDTVTNPKEAKKATSDLYCHDDPEMPNSQEHDIATDAQTDSSAQPNTEDVKVLCGTPRQERYSWKLIKGTREKERGIGTYTVNDLVLQALTGIPINNILGSPVPLHTASRAMRHTATLKMHKIMERLANERTRYQKHEMDELKKVMGGKDCIQSKN